jgi:hypothetical protein
LTRYPWDLRVKPEGPFFDDVLDNDFICPTPLIKLIFGHADKRLRIEMISWVRLDPSIPKPENNLAAHQLAATGPHRLGRYFAYDANARAAMPIGPEAHAIADAIQRGFAVKLATGHRNLPATIQFHKLVLAHSTTLSANYLDMLDALPNKIFADLHDEVALFRLAAEGKANRKYVYAYERSKDACEDGIERFWRED